MRLNNNSDRYLFLCTVELDTECTPNVPNSSSITSVVAAAPVSMSSRQNLSSSDYLLELTAVSLLQFLLIHHSLCPQGTEAGSLVTEFLCNYWTTAQSTQR